MASLMTLSSPSSAAYWLTESSGCKLLTVIIDWKASGGSLGAKEGTAVEGEIVGDLLVGKKVGL